MSRFFAQAALLPNNGASNASDFQPPTRNPQQNPVNTQQQQGNLQNPTTQEVLGRSDLKIAVPTSTTAQIAQPTPTPQPTKGTNWLAVFVIVAIVVSGAAYFLSKQHTKRKRPVAPKRPEPQEVLLVPADEEDSAEEAPVATQPTAAKTPPKKKAKKSKSKRKHK